MLLCAASVALILSAESGDPISEDSALKLITRHNVQIHVNRDPNSGFSYDFLKH